MADVWANLMACHPRATYHIARCCHLVNSLSRFQSHMPHCRVQSPGEINVTIVPHSWCKNSIRHIENRSSPYFFWFLMQFRALGFDERRLSYRDYCLRYTCFSFFLFFSLPRPQVALYVRSGRMRAQNALFHARKCLFGV